MTTLRRGLDSRPGAVIGSENRAVSCSNYCAVQKVAKPLTVENIVGRLGALYRIQNWYTVEHMNRTEFERQVQELLKHDVVGVA